MRAGATQDLMRCAGPVSGGAGAADKFTCDQRRASAPATALLAADACSPLRRTRPQSPPAGKSKPLHSASERIRFVSRANSQSWSENWDLI